MYMLSTPNATPPLGAFPNPDVRFPPPLPPYVNITSPVSLPCRQLSSSSRLLKGQEEHPRLLIFFVPPQEPR